jgi:signal transduction histidine kinase
LAGAEPDTGTERTRRGTTRRRLAGILRWPAGWPVRRRIAFVSAVLTLVILVGFAAVVGRLATERIQADFRKDVRSVANGLAFTYSVSEAVGGELVVEGQDPTGVALANNAAVRLVQQVNGHVLAESVGAPYLGPARRGEFHIGSLQVASRLVYDNSSLGAGPIFVQYARDRGGVEATVGRLWLFLGAGVLVGTLLAAFGSFAVAGRAMRPLTQLTAAAREIGTTRDPSVRIPQPETEDEVADLARTLDEMLGELDAARSETEQAMQRQREFVADASHELRTPLTSILANLEMLHGSLSGPEADEDGRAAAESALRSSRRMTRLVADLLLLARADAGRASGWRDCDLSVIAADVAVEVAPVAGRREIHLEAPEPVPLRGNPDELHRMVLNLLENATRHTPEGTNVRIVVGNENGSVRLEVSDDGPGVPEGAEEQVFERFVRGSGPADLVHSREGAGLGLAIVRAVARSHGGDAQLHPVATGGAGFVVRIPVADGRAEA